MNFPGGMQKFMKQANQMQTKLAKLQDQLATMTIEAASGGGAVTVVMTGAQVVQKIDIKQDVVDSKDKEMLQDLIMTAVNEATKKSKKLHEDEVNKITGGMSIPGLF